MKKFLLKFFYFLAVAVLLNVLYVLVLLAFSPGFHKVYETVNFKNKDYDIIVLGNSMALDGIDAGYLSENGLSTYNLAIAGDHISTSVKLFRDYLKENKKPKQVVVGLSSAIGKSYLNPVPFENPEVEFFYNPSLYQNIINPPLLNFQWLAVDLFKIIISNDHRNATMVLGQWRTQKVIPDHSQFKASEIKMIDYRDPFLQELADLCKQEQIQLVLTELPGSKAKQNQLPYVYQARLKDDSQITVYNLNNHEVASRLLDDSKDWLAQDHLNQHGGRKVTTFLLHHILMPKENTTNQTTQVP